MMGETHFEHSFTSIYLNLPQFKTDCNILHISLFLLSYTHSVTTFVQLHSKNSIQLKVNSRRSGKFKCNKSLKNCHLLMKL